MIQDEQSKYETIIPQKGEQTKFLINVFGEDDASVENKQEREIAMVVDGVKSATDRYDIHLGGGFYYLLAKETLHTEGYPNVGLKIHLALDVDSPDLALKLREVAQLCLEKDSAGKSTTFKVMTYGSHKSDIVHSPDQANKFITIYPNYVSGGKTNVSETIRLITSLREIMGNSVDAAESIYSEHRGGAGIFLRAGAFTKQGQAYERIKKDLPFADQLRGNLNSPETDSAMFVKEVTEAMEKGLL